MKSLQFQPTGFVDIEFSSHVCKLWKAIHGFKQSPRALYMSFTFLLVSGIQISHSWYISFPTQYWNLLVTILFILVVIMMLFFCHFMALIAPWFLSRILGHYFTLWCGTYFSLTWYFAFSTVLFLGLFLAPTCSKTSWFLKPLPTSSLITVHSGVALNDPIEYLTIVGSFQYLSLARFDMSFTDDKLSEFMHHPTTDDWTLVKCL